MSLAILYFRDIWSKCTYNIFWSSFLEILPNMDALLKGIYWMNTIKTMKSNRKGRDCEMKILMIRIISTKIIRNSYNNIFEAGMSVKNEEIEAVVEICAFNKKRVYFWSVFSICFYNGFEKSQHSNYKQNKKNLHELYPCFLYVCLWRFVSQFTFFMELSSINLTLWINLINM